ncbi:MAG: choline dehydrogenase [Pseudomonadales bacterium]|nr:choline dehydrogenase [Pseudomonadales bacterium]
MYDYIIVGAGSAGCVLANRLSADPANQVLLLEAGKKDSSPFIHMPAGVGQLIQGKTYNWAFDTAPEPALGDRRLYWPRGKGLGGSSSINGMVYIRGHAQDYDRWRQLGNEGWSYEEVLPYFRKSMNQERGEDAFHGVGGPLNVKDGHASLGSHSMFIEAAQEAGYPYNPDFNGVEQEGVGPYQLTKIGNERCSAARGYLTPVLDRENLTVITGAHLERVLFEGKRACGVQVSVSGNSSTEEAAREVIICAGAVQSPQLLMLSGIGSREELAAHGIDCLHDLPGVGKNLQDHLDVVIQYHCKDGNLTLDKYVKLYKLPYHLVRYLLFKDGRATENPLEAGGFVKTRPDLEVPDLQLHFIPVFMIDHGRQRGPGPGMCLHVCQLRPESRGEITISSNDPFAAPVIKANYLSEPGDLEVLVEGVKIARRIFATEVFRPVLGEEFEQSRDAQTDDEIKDFIRQYAETIYHPVGTCKMGHDDMAVVDARLRVRGIERLRVVDASVMPTLVGGNTNAPTIMIAEKAAEMIMGDNAYEAD